MEISIQGFLRPGWEIAAPRPFLVIPYWREIWACFSHTKCWANQPWPMWCKILLTYPSGVSVSHAAIAGGQTAADLWNIRVIGGVRQFYCLQQHRTNFIPHLVRNLLNTDPWDKVDYIRRLWKYSTGFVIKSRRCLNVYGNCQVPTRDTVTWQKDARCLAEPRIPLWCHTPSYF